MKKYMRIIIGAVVVIALLTVSFLWESFPGENADLPDNILQEKASEDKEGSGDILTDAGLEKNVRNDISADNRQEKAVQKDISADTLREEPARSDISTDNNQKEAPDLPQPENPSAIPDPPLQDDYAPAPDKLICTLSVRCDTILHNMDKVKEEKKQIIPPGGVIYAERDVVFYEDETAFNVLLREMKQNRIHFEFETTPAYDSIYIEGIGNIYEFDAGELSGWLYKVNGKFLNYSLSRYPLKNGDKIEIVYTCNLGKDIS